MFRIVSTIILLIAFTIQCFHVGGIVLGYYMNTPAYAKNCVNKAKPVLKCNGKCQMSQKILEQQKKEDQSSTRSSENTYQLIAYSSFFVSAIPKSSSIVTRYPGQLVAHQPLGHIKSIFHPPSLV